MELKHTFLKYIIKHDITTEILLYGPSAEVRKILVALQQLIESISNIICNCSFHIFVFDWHLFRFNDYFGFIWILFICFVAACSMKLPDENTVQSSINTPHPVTDKC